MVTGAGDHIGRGHAVLLDRIAGLQIPPGPWTLDVWPVREAAGDSRRATQEECAVDKCDRDVYWLGNDLPGPDHPHPDLGLCYAHYFRWWRSGKGAVPVRDWLGTNPAQIGRPRGRPDVDYLDFRGLPPVVAHEVRFVVGTKISRGDWTANRALRRFLLALIEVARSDCHASVGLLSRSGDEWLFRLRQRWQNTAFDRVCAPYVRSFFRLLEGATDPNPWSNDHWHWRDRFEFTLASDATVNTDNRGPLDWTSIAPSWLKQALKAHARQQLVTSQVAWSTVGTWIRASKLFSEFLAEVGISAPQEVTRPVFLDYLEWARRNRGGLRTALGSVSTMACLLETLHDTGHLAELGSQVFLRRGENARASTRNPRPFPPDVIERVDRLIVDNPHIDATVRTMIATTRWAGCRISELVALPIECLQHNKSGYWIEYWMTKTQAWRRFPIPDSLAEVLLEQQRRVRAGYGNGAAHLFPGNRSNAHSGITRPWSASGLRQRLSTLFAEQGITHSTVTGEVISGGDVHRFRHTVGMTLLNNGWTQQEVRDFLGHASETMTSAYARITDDTLARKAREFWATQAHTAGPVDVGVERLRAKFSAALPNGFCTLPAQQKCDFRPNPCLDCSFHDPGGWVFLGTHIAHRDQLRQLITDARTADDQQVVDLNQPMLDKVEKLIDELRCDAPASGKEPDR
ncbi:tyrosine-type recombinase/integrase [Mycobacteroides chelonae]|uniref:tyrosine-type recombinase/integrase n=1 Tax=Mycobacteroides chelonae TaxID=1774 RepID=UPI0018B03F3B|nr:tyrosine-type recombinase/integrase [Mycobacteroides chelonae]MBF9318026.1 phage integrase family protein [Mycobacteroides chelonae]